MKKLHLLVIILISAFSANARTYYVAKNGNDNQSGSEASPWETINKAGYSLTAGDTVLIKQGIYKERVKVVVSGTADKPIVFRNYKNDEVIIDGATIWLYGWGGVFHIQGQSHIFVEGLKVQNSSYGGFWIEKSEHIYIKNNSTFKTNSCGIGVWESEYVIIINNEIEKACNGDEQECISIADSRHCEVSYNHVHHNGLYGTKGGEGIDVKAGSSYVNVYNNHVHDIKNRIGIYVDAWNKKTSNISIYNNVVHHCSSSGIALATEKGTLLENIYDYNNISYLNKWHGIEIGDWTEGNVSNTPIKNVFITNNTFYKNGIVDGGGGILIDNADAENIFIQNNICSENNDFQIAIRKSNGNIYTVSNNLIYGFRGANGELKGDSVVLKNPFFKQASSFNFSLQEKSPAIDKGTFNNAPIFDIENKVRPIGKTIDLGAYEFGINKEPVVKDGDLFVYPNPATYYCYVEILKYKELKLNYQIELYNLYGGLVTTPIYTQKSRIYLPLTKLQAGIYFIVVRERNSILFTKRLIVLSK